MPDARGRSGCAGCLVLIALLVVVGFLLVSCVRGLASSGDPDPDGVCDHLNHNSSERLVEACLEQGR